MELMFWRSTQAEIWPLSASSPSITQAADTSCSYSRTKLSPQITGRSPSRSHRASLTRWPGGGTLGSSFSAKLGAYGTICSIPPVWTWWNVTAMLEFLSHGWIGKTLWPLLESSLGSFFPPHSSKIAKTLTCSICTSSSFRLGTICPSVYMTILGGRWWVFGWLIKAKEGLWERFICQ